MAAGFTLRECARAGQTLAERCVPCTFAAGALGASAAIAYYNSETYFESLKAADRQAKERSAEVVASIKQREEERFLETTAAIMRDNERRKEEAAVLDRYVDPRSNNPP